MLCFPNVCFNVSFHQVSDSLILALGCLYGALHCENNIKVLFFIHSQLIVLY